MEVKHLEACENLMDQYILLSRLTTHHMLLVSKEWLVLCD